MKKDIGFCILFILLVAWCAGHMVGAAFGYSMQTVDPYCPRHESGHYTKKHPKDCHEH